MAFQNSIGRSLVLILSMMKRILSVSALLISLTAVSCGGHEESNPIKENVPVDGKTVYLNNCVICHGEDGKLGAAGAKDLSVSTLNDADVLIKIKQGGNGMTAFQGMISDEEIKAVSDYVKHLRAE